MLCWSHCRFIISPFEGCLICPFVALVWDQALHSFGSISFALLPIFKNSDSDSSNIQSPRTMADSTMLQSGRASRRDCSRFFWKLGKMRVDSWSTERVRKECLSSWSSSKLANSCAACRTSLYVPESVNKCVCVYSVCSSFNVKHKRNVEYWKECGLISQHTTGRIFFLTFFQLLGQYSWTIGPTRRYDRNHSSYLSKSKAIMLKYTMKSVNSDLDNCKVLRKYLSRCLNENQNFLKFSKQICLKKDLATKFLIQRFYPQIIKIKGTPGCGG